MSSDMGLYKKRRTKKCIVLYSHCQQQDDHVEVQLMGKPTPGGIRQSRWFTPLRSMFFYYLPITNPSESCLKML